MVAGEHAIRWVAVCVPAGGEPLGELSEADKEALGQWINPAYLAPQAWKSIQARLLLSS